ncbi:TY1B-A [Symbiodinium sp. CCMP2592]|nr:TY1B-A [Symbiodinium sp. CCMP2592]
MERGGRDQVPSWDGEAAGWNTYVRRVRLYWERTPSKKRKLVGAELASRLSGRAWDVSGDLDHARLQGREGATYLLEYLETRLGRSAIPDLGTRLEDFLVRLRISEEDHHRVAKEGGTSHVASGIELWTHRSRASAAIVVTKAGLRLSGRTGGMGKDSDEDDEPEPEWERFQLEEVDALPQEVLGWILLRRAHLPSHARLSVLAATNNKLDLDLIEKALRDQEEDLLQAEERRGPRRTYWVEQEGSWGLLLDDLPADDSQGNVHWVGERLPEEVHPVFSAEEEPETWCSMHGDAEVYWSYLDGDWWTEDPEGVWWNWSDAKPWFEVNEAMAVDPAVGKELQEALTLYQDKVRSFKESRQLVAARNTARPNTPASSTSSPSAAMAADGGQKPGSSSYTGCFICGAKDHDFRRCPKRGSGKGAGAAHLLSDSPWSEAPTFMVMPGDDAAEPGSSAEAFAVQGNTQITEQAEMPLCYMHVIAGNPQDDFAFGNFQMEAAMSVTGQLHPGFAVIDSGATETVGSLDAIEAVVAMRRQRYGMESVRVYPEARRSFRFGNAQQETATSYVEVPQTLGGNAISLGVFALDVPRIPILLSIRTLKKLGAEINFQRKTIVFKAVDPGVTIGLQESASGHLLLDLAHDWLRTPGAGQSFSGTVLSQVLSGYKEGAGHVQQPEPGGPDSENFGVFTQQPPEPQLPEQAPGHEHPPLQSALLSSSGASVCEHALADRHVAFESVPPEVPSHVPIFDMTAADETSRESMGTLLSQQSPRQLPLRDHGYDVSRAVGPDPRDPRTAGPPCNGNHVPMAAGRGSLSESGANAHGRWEVCKECRLRLLYVPAFGAHAHYRQAGPLPVDAKKAVEIMEERVAAGKPAAKETLNAKAVALQGAEDSLLRRLETVRSQKAQALGKASSEKEKDGGYPKDVRAGDLNDKPKDRGARPKVKAAAQAVSSDSGMSAKDDPQRVPKKSVKRNNPKAAEEQEALTNAEAETWTKGFLAAEGSLQNDQAATIRESMKEILAGFDHDVADLPKHRSGVHVLEVGTSGASGLRNAVEDRHGTSARMSPFEYDFGRKAGVEQALEAARARSPALLWVSVPCGALEQPEDSVPEGPDDSQRTHLHRRRRCRKVFKTALRLAEDQVRRGAHMAWEWPKDSLAWKEPEMKGFMAKLAKRGHLHVAIFLDEAAGKKWQIVSTSPDLRRSIVYAQEGLSSRRSAAAMSRSLSVSSRYPPKLCRAVAEFALQADHLGGAAAEAQAFGLSDEPLLESKLDPADRKRAEALVHRLHVRAGHPSGKTLAKVLRARGAHHEVIKIAMEHTCPDCQEMRLPDLSPSVSLQQSEVPWKVIQIDNAEIRVDDTVTHFMLITDEATHFTVVAKLFDRHYQDGRNATAEEAILAIEQHWTQAYGFPDRLRCDPEGCFRSKLLEAWAADIGIEVTPCPAEAHHQIGQVESLVRKMKQDATTLLAGHPVGAHRALLHCAAAHNTVHRVQGFSPAQWAFGRDFGVDGRLFESEQGLPLLQNAVESGHSFHDHMAVRTAAEDIYRKSQASYQLGRLLNMKSRRKVQFIPGDLVFYRRVQPPADTPAHPGLGFAKVGQGRWFGPGRVLATETRSDAQGMVRKPSQTVWVISNGRLKRCSPDQLRHASEREAAIAEATDAATPPWTFHSLLQTLEGTGFETFDDYVFPEDIGSLPHVSRGRSRARSREPATARNEGTEKQGAEKRERSAQNPVPRTPGGPPAALPTVDPQRYLGDPTYF